MAGEKVTEEEERESIQFSVLLIKMKDGAVGLRAPDDAEIAVDDIYGAICTLKRNIEAQNTAAMIQQAMMATAQQVQKMQNGGQGNRTEGGLIVPDDIKVKK